MKLSLILAFALLPLPALAAPCDPTRPGCAVTAIIQNRCATCHDEIPFDLNDDFGRLDLSHWIELPDGTFAFPHVDANGNQLPTALTMRQILDRITSDDPDFRMPLGDQVVGDDLVAFTSWLKQ
jgi:hypothetical protein